MSNKAWLLLLFLSLIWGSSFYFIGEGVKSVPPLTLVFYRIFFAGLALYLVFLLLRRRLPKKLDFWIKVAVMALLNNIIPFTLIAWGQQTISGGLASILNSNTAFATVFLASVGVANLMLTVSLGFSSVYKRLPEPFGFLPVPTLGSFFFAISFYIHHLLFYKPRLTSVLF